MLTIERVTPPWRGGIVDVLRSAASRRAIRFLPARGCGDVRLPWAVCPPFKGQGVQEGRTLASGVVRALARAINPGCVFQPHGVAASRIAQGDLPRQALPATPPHRSMKSRAWFDRAARTHQPKRDEERRMPISISLSAADASEKQSDALVIPVPEGEFSENPRLEEIDAPLEGQLFSLTQQAKFHAAPDQVLNVPTLGQLPVNRLILVGMGTPDGDDEPALRRAVAAGVRESLAHEPKSIAIVLPDGVGGKTLRAVGEGVVLGAYRFTKYRTGERAPVDRLAKVTVHKRGRISGEEKAALALGEAVGQAVCVARDAVNEPPNELTPAVLAERAKEIARRGKLKVRVLDKKGIKDAKMLLHYAVGQGSANEPRFIHLTYSPASGKRSRKRMVFVGKGLTFDSGGLCIKPASGMWEMKSDMGGAAAVLALMAAVAEVKPDVEVHGIIGAAENMPDGLAYRPGDVFGSLDGKTVEIINTDAEGRLVLADALTYAAKLKPDVLVDAATLTGACVVALGKSCSGYYTADDTLGEALSAAALAAGERMWRMPLLAELGEQLKSDVADLKHVGDRWGGSITAALFLKEFTNGVPWIHCDIAGPALADQARGMYPKGGTGHPVLTFLRLVEGFA